MITKTKRKPSKTTLKHKMDKIWSGIIREKQFCEMCGRPANNPHHVVGRRILSIRWDLRNGCLLCTYCHLFSKFSAHQDPLGFMEWFKRKRPYDYEYLLAKKNELFDGDYEVILEELKAKI